MKKTIGCFVTGCAIGLAIPYFFGTLSRCRKPRQIREIENQQEQIEEVVDKRFQFPRPTCRYTGEYKLVIGIRMDRKPSHTEMASLTGDIAVKSVVESMQKDAAPVLQWLHYGQAKIATKVPNLEKMESIISAATAAGVQFSTIEVDGEPAIIGVGPGPVEEVNKITSDLKLI